MANRSAQVEDEVSVAKGGSNRVTRFEDLIAWRKARALTKEIYVSSAAGRFARDFGLASQIQRAAVSIMSNIAEGFERAHPREFHQALATARGSCAEVRSQLYVALDAGYIDAARFKHLQSLAEEVGRIIGGLRLAVARKLSTRSSRGSNGEPQSS